MSIEPFDPQLREDSPCIDAGDPDSPLDPDDTRADIGAFYYHQKMFTQRWENDIQPEVELLSIYPNPFNALTRLRFSLPEQGRGRLAIYDLTGRMVARLVDGKRPAGYHSAVWDAAEFPSGIYFARLDWAERTATLKLTLVK